MSPEARLLGNVGVFGMRDCVYRKHENPPNNLPAGVGGAGPGDLLTGSILYPISTSMHNIANLYGLYLSSKFNTNDLNSMERAALQMTQVFNLDTIV